VILAWAVLGFSAGPDRAASLGLAGLCFWAALGFFLGWNGMA
jgi:hypothetical protein